jgi:pimeloyl-ACP methyl ester carboxylesterase
MKLEKVTSSDGTTIAFEMAGSGPPLILVGGAFHDRRGRVAGTPLAALLASRFTVISYDRRGRGDSDDRAPYAIERELEDLDALIRRAGGAALVYGNSSGAVLSLHAAVVQLPIRKLALYEPPLVLDPERAALLQRIGAQLEDASSSGRRADAVALFLTDVVQLAPSAVAQMRSAPVWPGLELLAHTLSYDVQISVRGSSLLESANAVRSPTLLLRGYRCPPWLSDAMSALGAALPAVSERMLQNESHEVNLERLAHALCEFFADERTDSAAHDEAELAARPS